MRRIGCGAVLVVMGLLSAPPTFAEPETGTISDAREIADAVVYLTEARNVTGRYCTWTVVRT